MSAAVKDKVSRVAKFIDKRIDELKSVKSQIEIAQDAGFVQVNMLSMIKKGVAKLPLDRVEALAKALDTDGVHLFRLALEQYFDMSLLRRMAPDLEGALSSNERQIVDRIRELSGGNDPQLSKKLDEALQTALK